LSIRCAVVRRADTTETEQSGDNAMAKYVLTYHGEGGMPETGEEVNQVMAAWGAWFEQLGAAVVDGGNPFGAASTISPDGSVSTQGPGLSGY
jgi:hypothetical protein